MEMRLLLWKLAALSFDLLVLTPPHHLLPRLLDFGICIESQCLSLINIYICIACYLTDDQRHQDSQERHDGQVDGWEVNTSLP